MPDLSLPLANLLSNIGNAALFGGAFLVLLGTWLAIWASGQKEHYSDERISANEAQTITANAEAAKAVRETEVIRKENLELSIKLEQERSARMKIESGLASRRVSGNKRELLIDALRDLYPKPKVFISRIVGDAETREFGDSLVGAMSEAGIQFSQSTIGIGIGIPEGLTVIIDKSQEASLLANAFKNAGLSASLQQGQPQDGFAATIIVGLKPPSF
ncbi:MAG: hypothetical protein WA231_22640 [Methylocella sp.]